MLGFKYADFDQCEIIELCGAKWYVLCVCSEVFGLPPQEDEHQPFPWTISLQSPQQNLLEDSKRWGILFFVCFGHFAVVTFQTMMSILYPESEPSLMIHYGSDSWVWVSQIMWSATPFQWMCRGLNADFLKQVCFHIKPREVRPLWTGWRSLMASLLLMTR